MIWAGPLPNWRQKNEARPALCSGRPLIAPVPLLRELASNTTDAIEHLNKNQIRPVSGDYPEYLDANADTAHELSRLIDTTVEYGHSKTKLERLRDEIQVASKKNKRNESDHPAP